MEHQKPWFGFSFAPKKMQFWNTQTTNSGTPKPPILEHQKHHFWNTETSFLEYQNPSRIFWITSVLFCRFLNLGLLDDQIHTKLRLRQLRSAWTGSARALLAALPMACPRRCDVFGDEGTNWHHWHCYVCYVTIRLASGYHQVGKCCQLSPRVLWFHVLGMCNVLGVFAQFSRLDGSCHELKENKAETKQTDFWLQPLLRMRGD